MSEILQNKTYTDYNYICRYSGFPYWYHSEDAKYIYGITSQLSKNISYTIHTVKNNETFDSISLYYYNSPLYFWVIMDFNNLQDPFEQPKVGSQLKIPTLAGISYVEV